MHGLHVLAYLPEGDGMTPLPDYEFCGDQAEVGPYIMVCMLPAGHAGIHARAVYIPDDRIDEFMGVFGR